MTPLDNPAENPCYGCGPQHARGLRLQFARRVADDGAPEVVATHTPAPDEIGWPGLLHTGLHFMTLFEACYWGALELTGAVHVAHGPQVFDQKRLPRVGQPFTAIARIVERAPDHVRLRARGVTADGRETATLESSFRPESRARIENAGLRLPEYLLDEMAP